MASRLPELRAVIKLMREQRATRVKLGGIEVELSPLAFALPSAPEKAEPVGVENNGEPTGEQLLYWSAGGDLPAAKQSESPQ